MSPSISVIVPIYEQWGLVTKLCDALSNQDFPASDYEVLLVDNGSQSIRIPQNMRANFRVLRCDTAGSYAARNFGIENAKGQWLVFTDADCRPHRQWLFSIAAGAARFGPDYLIAGRVEMVPGSSRPTPYEIYDMLRGIPQDQYVRNGYAATANLAFHRSLVDRIGSFDCRRFSGGDADICRRARAAGFKIVLIDEALVSHSCRSTWDEVAVKARRIRGGQLTAGSPRRYRSFVTGVTLPTVKVFWRFLRQTQFPIRHRLIACLVLLRVWGVQLAETFRLKIASSPERR